MAKIKMSKKNHDKLCRLICSISVAQSMKETVTADEDKRLWIKQKGEAIDDLLKLGIDYRGFIQS